MRAIFLVLAGLSLTSCAHPIQLTPRDGGPIAYGTAPAGLGDKGKLTVNLDGKVYTGRWVLVRSGAIGFGSAFTGMTTVSSSAIGMEAGGGGQAILSAPDGSRLRCAFRYSEISAAGLGECVDDAGKIYDMMIG